MRLIATLCSYLPLIVAVAAGQQRPAHTRAVPIELVCGPTASLSEPDRTLRIVGGQERTKTLFATGDTVIINGGTAREVRAGQHYLIRRVVDDRFALRTTEKAPVSIHTAGWLTIVEAKQDTAVGRIAEACDGISDGDYLEPLVLTPALQAKGDGEPDFARPARVILADDRRQLGGGGGSLMVIDRGTDHGLKAGQRLTLFRYSTEGTGSVVAIGDAHVASTQPETSLIRIDKAREAVQVGDLVAIHR